MRLLFPYSGKIFNLCKIAFQRIGGRGPELAIRLVFPPLREAPVVGCQVAETLPTHLLNLGNKFPIPLDPYRKGVVQTLPSYFFEKSNLL
jgi:hypothetical protein